MRSNELTKLSEPTTNLASSIVYIMLLRSGKYSFLPELLDVVGKDQMMDLLQMFAGMKMQFPTMEELQRYAKEVSIFFRLEKVKPQHRPSVVKDLSDEYFLEEDMINIIYKKIGKLVVNDLQIKM